MRRFHFRLERLLAIRRYHEREWELKLAAATLSVLETRRGIRDARDGISRSLDTPSGPLDLLEILAAEQYRGGMAARIVVLEGELEIRERALAKVREGYLDASRQRKVLDKLKERQSGGWRKEQGRQEIAVQNEIGVVQAVRSAATGGAPDDVAAGDVAPDGATQRPGSPRDSRLTPLVGDHGVAAVGVAPDGATQRPRGRG